MYNVIHQFAYVYRHALLK